MRQPRIGSSPGSFTPAICISPAVRPPSPVATHRKPPEANQRKMPERRHRTAFEQAHAAVALGPLRQSLPAEFRPPAEPPCHRGKALLEAPTRSRLGAEMVDPADFAGLLGDAGR